MSLGDRMTKTMREPKPGFTWLGCHPAAEAGLDTRYRSELRIELYTFGRVRLGAEGN
jgi:hypothetical protein